MFIIALNLEVSDQQSVGAGTTGDAQCYESSPQKILSEHKTMGNDRVGFLRLLVHIFYRPNNKQIRLNRAAS